MAIAGITVQTLEPRFVAVRARLAAADGVVDVTDSGEPCLLAAVVEADAARLENVLAEVAGWEGVLNVGLVSVNYEDDLDEHGCIPCPPRKPRHRGAACFDGPTPGESGGGKA